ncbi:hypothetical protein VTO42DRAFT_2272 [Malbranchea cinnamomea]
MTREKPLEILLYGLGAIGSFYAFILDRSDSVRLTVVARSNYEAVTSKGITIKSQNHGEHVVKPYKVVKTPAESGQIFDYIVCCHKAVNHDSVPGQFAAVVDATRTTFVIIQNGVGNEEPFRNAFPECSILSCVTWVGAAQKSPGVVEHFNSEDLQIGLYPNEKVDSQLEQQRLDTFASLLRNGKTVFQVVPNIQVQRWEKVVWNAAWNSLTTLTLLDTKSWLSSSPDALPMTRRLMTEVIDVARRCGVPIGYDLIDRLIDKIMAMPGIGSSMQADYLKGKPMEVDVILGTPVKKARELGMSVPVAETLYTLLTAINTRFLSE